MMYALSDDKRIQAVPGKLTEKDITRQIRDCLHAFKVFHWKAWQGPMSQPKGVADIIGIYRGKPMAIEVKKPGGRLSDDQAKFLKRWAEEGGIAIVAYSVDAVIGQLGLELPMFRKDKRRG